jgi:hypothetical protein
VARVVVDEHPAQPVAVLSFSDDRVGGEIGLEGDFEFVPGADAEDEPSDGLDLRSWLGGDYFSTLIIGFVF